MYKIRFILLVAILVFMASEAGSESGGTMGVLNGEGWKLFAAEMVKNQIAGRGVKDIRVLDAMSNTPRHFFVPKALEGKAYNDYPLPIGEDQTISQPYIVGLMTELLSLSPTDRVLEIGTGSGYQAAILGKLAAEVYSIEILCSLAASARERLHKMGFLNVHVLCGDGYKGWPDKAPFDAIIVTAAPPEVPQALLQQLKVGGRLVLPVGEAYQELRLITKIDQDTFTEKKSIPVRFVPMVHASGTGGP